MMRVIRRTQDKFQAKRFSSIGPAMDVVDRLKKEAGVSAVAVPHFDKLVIKFTAIEPTSFYVDWS